MKNVFYFGTFLTTLILSQYLFAQEAGNFESKNNCKRIGIGGPGLIFGNTVTRCNILQTEVDLEVNGIEKFDKINLYNHSKVDKDARFEYKLNLNDSNLKCSIQIHSSDSNLSSDSFTSLNYSSYVQLNGADEGQNARIFSKSLNNNSNSIGIYCRKTNRKDKVKISLAEVQELTKNTLVISSDK